MKRSALKLERETLRALTGADLARAAGGLPTANVSAENASCCSFDVACPTEECATRRQLSCRFC